MPQPLKLRVHGIAADEAVASMTVNDVKGSYTVPWVQTSRDLNVDLAFDASGVVSAKGTLLAGGRELASQTTGGPEFRMAFPGLSPGEYTLRIEGEDAGGRVLAQAAFTRIGVGAVIAAIGDSITEGYFGRGFLQEDLNLKAGDFPPDAVSRDGRNFPQYAPTTQQHLPSVNCFESWMTRLNDALSASWKEPVFIANEGWGGITSGGYLNMMRNDGNWRERILALRPNVWILHLGVNDERAHVTREDFKANMGAIVDLLMSQYGATPKGIFLAKPCYDYFEGAQPILEEYGRAIDELVQARGLQAGADFFLLFSTDRERWYGTDVVHPNVAGMDRMAQGWHDAIVAALPHGPAPR